MINSLRFCFGLFLLLLLSTLIGPAHAATLEKIISHEHPAFNPVIARLVVGRDGLIYLAHERSLTGDGYMIRIKRDGSEKAGVLIAYSNRGVAVNAEGTYVVAETHFAHSATTYDKNSKRIAAFTEFENSNYDAPQHVEAGESNDFYAADVRGKRIVRFGANGKLVKTYPVTANEFRVSEKNQAFYVAVPGKIVCIGFDGQTRWEIPAIVGGDPWNGYTGGFDVGTNGVLYVAQGQSTTIKTFDASGKSVGDIALLMGATAPGGPFRISDLRINGDEVIVRRNSPIELFQSYDAKTGAQKKVINTDYEKLAVSYSSEIWTAGETTPLTIDFSGAANKPAPNLHVWARPFGAPGYRELKLEGGKVLVPPDMGGLYQLKVSPETSPQMRREEPKQLVRSVVEIRRAGSKGTVNVWTPDNRWAYARGEEIPFTIAVRAGDADRPREVILRLISGTKVLIESKATLSADGKLWQSKLSSMITKALRAGEYSLVAVAPNLTSVSQPLIIGNRPDNSPFRITQFGDYGTDMSYDLSVWNAPDVASFYAQRSRQLGLNMIAERVRANMLTWNNIAKADLDELTARLQKDPLGASPEKVRIPSPYLQSMAAYGASGVEHMPILLGNDASTTLGVGFDPRTPEQLSKDIETITGVLKEYAAFRGWDWAANWWAAAAGADALTTPEQKKAFRDALARAKNDGAWDAVLEEAAHQWLDRAPNATKLFNEALQRIAPDKATAVAAPYRNACAYPPITFQNVGEVDLHFQAEQMYPPYSFLHDVDFYKRPGKPAWAHPEIWNDSGTGEQIMRESFGLAMRGADGVGFSGGVGWNSQPEDTRSAANGTASIYRATFGVLREYGPWLTSLKNDDRVAIIASPRMFMLDEWSNTWGTHFARVMEAYDSCLHAHHPASIVFVDDMKAETLAKYKAVLIVGQRIELEAVLQTNLKNAKAAGTKIFYDGTCRESLVKEYSPLGIAFDKMEKDPHTWGDDPAFAPYRFPAYVKANLPALHEKLDAVVTPEAQTENAEVLLTERIAGQGRYVFALNNTTPELDPAQMWRFGLFVATRVPVQAPIKMSTGSGAVYDVFAQKPVTPQNGIVNADLRDLPLRIFAILPAPIARLGLRGPQSVAAGQAFNCGAWVQDEKGVAFKTAIPVHLRLVDSNGITIDERFLAANGADGATSTLQVPLDTTGNLTLEATELFSGKSAKLTIAVGGAQLPNSLQWAALKPADMASKATQQGGASTAADNEFGPHLRDIALSQDGATAAINAFNWNENLYGLDVNTGQVRWQKRLGQGFTFAPQATPNGIAVQGFDFTRPYSYYLYLADNNGVPSRRFGLYGLSRRLPHRFLASLFNDRLNQFAVSPDGDWVASCGDLGVAVWDKSGKLLWKRDDYKSTHSKPRFAGLSNWNASLLVTPVIAAQSATTLLVLDDMQATAYSAATGKEEWNTRLATNGTARKALLSEDGKTTAILSTTAGGRIFLLHGNKLVESIPAVADDIALSSDGSRIAAVNSTQLSQYELGKGLRWIFNGDEYLHNPRIARDGRIAVSSKLGSLYVLSPEGQVLLHRDMKALAMPRWLANGDLLLSTWMGDVVRLDARYSPKWRVHLKPRDLDMRGKILAPDSTPTNEVNTWTNSEEKPSALTPNLLNGAGTQVTLFINNQKIDAPALFDGKAEAAKEPLVGWGHINWLGESTAQNWIEMQTPAAQATVKGITLVEDATHPESWLRDAYLEYWDELRKDWNFVMPLLSNGATHTHRLATPITANRWRIVLPPGVVSNIRLGEIVLHS